MLTDSKNHEEHVYRRYRHRELHHRLSIHLLILEALTVLYLSKVGQMRYVAVMFGNPYIFAGFHTAEWRGAGGWSSVTNMQY